MMKISFCECRRVADYTRSIFCSFLSRTNFQIDDSINLNRGGGGRRLGSSNFKNKYGDEKDELDIFYIFRILVYKMEVVNLFVYSIGEESVSKLFYTWLISLTDTLNANK